MTPMQYAKAIVAAAIAGLSALAPALDGGITSAEATIIAVATLTGLGLVFAVPNKAPAGRPADPELSEQSGL